MARRNWSELEVEATVADYFAMLQSELRGEPFNKTAHRRALAAQLDGRSDAAIERKHQNISAILIELGFPYVDGYKPLGNYQGLVREVVEARLHDDPTIHAVVQEAVDADEMKIPTVEDFLAALEDPPTGAVSPSRGSLPRDQRRIYGETNYLQREASNASLGQAGELFVMNFERARFTFEGREALADRIEHVSATEGDHVGFDVRSFEVNGSDRCIEVKTTRYGKDTPFFVSRNQVSVSADLGRRYHLYRLFKFAKDPRLFTVSGPLSDVALLEPVEFLARVR